MRFTIDPERLIDISRPLSEDTPCWPGDTPFERSSRTEYGFRTSRLVLSCHSGTHMDAPCHLESLSGSIDDISTRRMILPCIVSDCTGFESVGVNDLKGLEVAERAMLFKTGSGSLSGDAADYLKSSGCLLVGIDSMSVDGPAADIVHRTLLGASIPIVENLLLDEVEPGEYLFMCFPLRIKSGDASPVRAFLHPRTTS